MGFLCWLLGHKEDKDNFLESDTLKFFVEKNAILGGKKVGTVECGFKMMSCERCQVVFSEKYVNNIKHDANCTTNESEDKE